MDRRRDKAERLFRFLKELVELRGHAVRTVDRYDTVLWLADVPEHPLCYRIDWSRQKQDDASEA